jgi:predicted phage terminase large subunit-like protein
MTEEQSPPTAGEEQSGTDAKPEPATPSECVLEWAQKGLKPEEIAQRLNLPVEEVWRQFADELRRGESDYILRVRNGICDSISKAGPAALTGMLEDRPNANAGHPAPVGAAAPEGGVSGFRSPVSRTALDTGNSKLETPQSAVGAWLASDLAAFVRAAWPVLYPERPLVWSWHYDLLCEHLTLVRQRKLRRLIINVPPRTAKSTITTILFPCWVWTTEPGHCFLCASYAAGLSSEHSVARRQLLGSAWFQALWGGRFKIGDGQDLKTQFDNDHRGQMIATSVGGANTGRGGDTLIVDDPLSAGQALSDAERTTANEWFDFTLRSRLNDPATGAIVVIMQRLHEHDLTGHLLEEQQAASHKLQAGSYEPQAASDNPEGASACSLKLVACSSKLADDWLLLRIPLVAEADERWRYPISGLVYERRAGEVLQPERFPPPVVEGLKARSLLFAGQYQQRPAPLEGNLVRREWIRYYGGVDPVTGAPDDPLPDSFDLEILSVDCAFKDLETGDYTAIGRIGVKGRRRYVLNVINRHLSMSATETAIGNWSRGAGALGQSPTVPLRGTKGQEPRSGIHAILIEDAANGPAIIERLKRNMRRVIAVTPEGGKLARFMAMQPEWEAGDWYVDRNAAWTEPLIGQLIQFPRAQHDDMCDMLSQASIWLQKREGGSGIVGYWTLMAEREARK